MASTRPRTTLHNIINSKIDDYEQQDNPQPKSSWQIFLRLFEHVGAVGRERAKQFRYCVNQITDESELKETILDEVLSKQGALNPSTVLRSRILEGLCTYYGVDMVALNEQAVENVLNINTAVLYADSSGTTLEEEWLALMSLTIQRLSNWCDNYYEADSEMQQAIKLHIRARD
jgi:hypothetical protein